MPRRIFLESHKGSGRDSASLLLFFDGNVKRLRTTTNGNMNFVTLLVIGMVLQIALSNLKT